MTVRYIAPEDTDSSCGFLVEVQCDVCPRRKFFSTESASQQSDQDVLFRYQHLKAQLLEAEWEAEVELASYKRFVTTSDPTLAPEKALGVHGLWLNFQRDRSRQWYAAFVITGGTRGSKRERFETQLFSQAWLNAVDRWAEQHGVLPEDRDRVLSNPPAPDRFSMLRRHMNALGEDIPVSCLNSVFAEQRDQLKASRLTSRVHPSSQKPTKSSMVSSEEAVIAGWFSDQITSSR